MFAAPLFLSRIQYQASSIVSVQTAHFDTAKMMSPGE
jgi:hypothetical protein